MAQKRIVYFESSFELISVPVEAVKNVNKYKTLCTKWSAANAWEIKRQGSVFFYF